MKGFWNLNFAVYCRFKSLIIQNASLFFLAFEEIHSTIGQIRKRLEHLSGLFGYV